MLFEKKHWWKETGIIIACMEIGSFLSLIFIVTPLIIFSQRLYDQELISMIFSYPFAFFMIWRLHKRAIAKKDGKYHVFQPKDWWKKFIMTIAIYLVIGFILFLQIHPIIQNIPQLETISTEITKVFQTSATFFSIYIEYRRSN